MKTTNAYPSVPHLATPPKVPSYPYSLKLWKLQILSSTPHRLHPRHRNVSYSSIRRFVQFKCNKFIRLMNQRRQSVNANWITFCPTSSPCCQLNELATGNARPLECWIELVISAEYYVAPFSINCSPIYLHYLEWRAMCYDTSTHGLTSEYTR